MVKIPLTVGENRILKELTAIAGGVGVMGDLSKLNEEQTDNIHGLKQKGYVVISGSHYVVVIPPRRK